MALRTQTKALEALRDMAADPPPTPGRAAQPEPVVHTRQRPPQSPVPRWPPTSGRADIADQSQASEGLVIGVAPPGRRGLGGGGENN